MFVGEVYSWGDNDEGQLGDGTTNAIQRPRLVASLLGQLLPFRVQESTLTAVNNAYHNVACNVFEIICSVSGKTKPWSNSAFLGAYVHRIYLCFPLNVWGMHDSIQYMAV